MHNKPRFKILSWKSRRTTSTPLKKFLWGPCLYFSLYVGMYINHTKNASQFTQRRCYVQLQCHVPTYNSAAICTYPSTLSIAVKIKPAVFRIALFMYIHGALSWHGPFSYFSSIYLYKSLREKSLSIMACTYLTEWAKTNRLSHSTDPAFQTGFQINPSAPSYRTAEPSSKYSGYKRPRQSSRWIC
jgi:hypothetical protein